MTMYVHTYSIRTGPDYHQHIQRLECYNSRRTATGWNFYNKASAYINQKQVPLWKEIEGTSHKTEGHMNDDFTNIGFW